MVYRLSCKDEGEYMGEPVNGAGDFVYYEDYAKLLSLVRDVQDTLETSVPLRGDSRHNQVLTRIKAVLEEN